MQSYSHKTKYSLALTWIDVLEPVKFFVMWVAGNVMILLLCKTLFLDALNMHSNKHPK